MDNTQAIEYFDNILKELTYAIHHREGEARKQCEAMVVHYALAIEALKEKQERENGCIYKFDSDTESWECSECGTLWTLMCGTPEENDMRYCTGCGRKLTEAHCNA